MKRVDQANSNKSLICLYNLLTTLLLTLVNELGPDKAQGFEMVRNVHYNRTMSKPFPQLSCKSKIVWFRLQKMHGLIYILI